MMFNGNDWIPVGIQGFSLTKIETIHLAFNPSTNQPYVAYLKNPSPNFGYGGTVTVMKFDGSAWVSVGASKIFAWEPSLAFNPVTHQPYVSYIFDTNIPTNTLGVNVSKFNGDFWESVGGVPVSKDFNTSLAFNSAPNGQVYVAYTAHESNEVGNVKVMMFNGNTWTSVGNTFSGSLPRLAFNPVTNQPYVAYIEDLNVDKPIVAVRMFNGNSWVLVGKSQDSSASWINLVFNPITNQPYIVYDDTVMALSQ